MKTPDALIFCINLETATRQSGKLESGMFADTLVGAKLSGKRVYWYVGFAPKAVTRAAAIEILDAVEARVKAAQDVQARRVPMAADTCYIEGHEVHVTLKGKRLLALDSGRGYARYFHVGAVPRGQSGRQEMGGPLVPGPWAFASGRAVCLTSSAAIRERDAAEEANAIKVDNGSRVWIDGVEYTVVVERGEFIELVPVDTSN
jgi:hypothetical protein